jgi:hypothetical protein
MCAVVTGTRIGPWIAGTCIRLRIALALQYGRQRDRLATAVCRARRGCPPLIQRNALKSNLTNSEKEVIVSTKGWLSGSRLRLPRLEF